MLTLKYAPTSEEARKIEEFLQELTLAYQKEVDPTQTTVVLEDGEQKLEGVPAIWSYLEDLQGELKQWYFCNC